MTPNPSSSVPFSTLRLFAPSALIVIRHQVSVLSGEFIIQSLLKILGMQRKK
jgi:hypothetical protein